MSSRTYSINVSATASAQVAAHINVSDVTDEFGGSFQFTRWADTGVIGLKIGYGCAVPMALQMAISAIDRKLVVGYSCSITITIQDGLTWKVSNEVVKEVKKTSTPESREEFMKKMAARKEAEKKAKLAKSA